MTNSFIDALIFVVDQLASLYLLIVLVRLVLPWMGTSYTNPLTQAVMAATSPLVVPIRRIVPAIGKLDTATVIVALGIQFGVNWIISVLTKADIPRLQLLALSGVELVQMLIWMFLIAIFIRIIVGWIWPHSYHPLVGLLIAFTEPVMRPWRRLIPPFGPIDISPIFAITLLYALSILASGLYRTVIQWSAGG